MPGIIEAHAHVGYWKDLKPSAEHFTREQPLSDFQRFAYHGVVAVLSMGADCREIAWPLRDERANPRAAAALFLSAGGLCRRAPPRPLSVKRCVSSQTTTKDEGKFKSWLRRGPTLSTSGRTAGVS
jgi:hypothetical protein